MSFKIGHFIYLAIIFVLGAFFLLVGLFSLALPWSSYLRQEVIQLLLDDILVFSLFGMGFAIVGLSLLIYTLLSTRRSYAYIRTGNHTVMVDEAIIQQYLDIYWQEHFPKNHIPSHLRIKKNSIQIVADLPSMPKVEQKLFLDRVRRDFDDIFGRILGYPHEIHLLASFQPEAKVAEKS